MGRPGLIPDAAGGMVPLSRGGYRIALAANQDDLIRTQELRARCFGGGQGGLDRDSHDAEALHFLIRTRQDDRLVGCFRVRFLPDGGAISRTYTAQSYDLSGLRNYPAPMAELGRFCTAPGHKDPDILRIAWAGLTRYVDENNIEMLFGCASFSGTDPHPYREVFALLQEEYLAPPYWRPAVRMGEIHDFSAPGPAIGDRRRALAALPPLLRSYLAMGGRVSDHAVIDRGLNTLHVFVGIEVKDIPESRQRLLRLIAAEGESDAAV